MISLKDYKYPQKGTKPILELVGLSSDEKPTVKFQGMRINNGSSFFEMDTGNVYFYDEETESWLSL